MKDLKRLFAACLTIFCLGQTLSAQEDEKAIRYPQIFVGLQGGGQTTLTDYDNWRLKTPTASVGIGAFFTPNIGARLHFNGIWDKGGFSDATNDFRYRYKYLTSDIDLMVNLMTLFGKKDYYPLNIYLIGGIGLNYAWDNDEAFAMKDMKSERLSLAYEGGKFSHNARIGTQLDLNVSKHVSINLEVAANCLKDRFNSKLSKTGDWQLTAQLGVSYKFSAKRKQKKTAEDAVQAVATETEEVWENRVDTVWYDEVTESTGTENGTKTWTVFYNIGKTDFQADRELADIGAFLRGHNNCKVEVKSYADSKTGNRQKNMELSKARCEKAVKALTDAGVPATSITSSYYGDTVQPFAESEKNRVTIIVANGLKENKEKKTERKFKTKTVHYRVK